MATITDQTTMWEITPDAEEGLLLTKDKFLDKNIHISPLTCTYDSTTQTLSVPAELITVS